MNRAFAAAAVAFLTSVVPIDAAAQTTGAYFDLDDGSGADPTGWTLAAGSGGVRSGTTITAPAAGARFYTYTAAPPNDVNVDNHQPWLIEAVISGNAIGAGGEQGARMWVVFAAPELMALPPPGAPKCRRVEARLQEDGVGVRTVALWGNFSNSSPAGEELFALNVDWARQPLGNPRYRIRLKRQRIDTSGPAEDYILLQVEASKRSSGEVWWDDPADPWTDNNPTTPDTDPPHRYSQRVLVNSLPFTTSCSNEIGFGHTNNGTADNTSTWESIFVSGAEETDTSSVTSVLPYWPPPPQAPIVSHDDKGLSSLQGVDFDVDLSTGFYLANDLADFWINAEATDLLDPLPAVDPSATGPHHRDFDGLVDDQAIGGIYPPVTGWVVVQDVSGRSRTSPAGQVEIPDRTPPTGLIQLRVPGGMLSAPLASYALVDMPDQIGVEIVEAHIDEATSSVTVNGAASQFLAGLAFTGSAYVWDAPVFGVGTNTIDVALVDLVGQANQSQISATFELLALAADGGPPADGGATSGGDSSGDVVPIIPGDLASPGDTASVPGDTAVGSGDPAQRGDPSTAGDALVAAGDHGGAGDPGGTGAAPEGGCGCSTGVSGVDLGWCVMLGACWARKRRRRRRFC